MIKILERRDDGTFVITHNGQPYHVTPDYSPELWAAVCAQEEIDPVAQAEIYAPKVEA